MSWSVDNTVAVISFGSTSLRVDLARPDLGLAFAGSEARLHFAAPDLRQLPALEEHYVRGTDLMASYPQVGNDPFGFHLELRVLDTRPVPILQCIVSVQTELLDCHPMVDIKVSGTCEARGGLEEESEWVQPPPSAPEGQSGGHLASPLTLVRQSDDEVLTLMLPPRDWPVTGFRVSAEHCQWRLFEEFLEKGVIRKARFWLALTDSATTLEQVEDWYAELCRVPLPLTT